MNTFNDTELMKALLPETSKSVYELEDELGKKLGKENVNYATLLRYFNRLSKTGFIVEEKGIKKNGKEDKRGTRKASLSFKGLVFLILKAELNEDESRAITQKLLSQPAYQKFHSNLTPIVQIGSDAIKQSFEQMKPKVNLEHYDEDYIRELWYDTVIQNLLNPVISHLKKTLPPGERELERYIKKAKSDLSKLPPDSLRMALVVYERLKSKRENYDEKIMRLKPFIKAFEKAVC